jgi:hypothetical protein
MTLFTTGTTGPLPEQLFRLPKLKQVYVNKSFVDFICRASDLTLT